MVTLAAPVVPALSLLLLLLLPPAILLAAAIEERIALWTLMPVYHGESMQVLRYGQGQKYDAHMVRISGVT